MKEYLKQNKGITLVALVVTIIVLIILAAVSINLVLGENGIIKKAQEGATNSEIGRENESLQMALGELRMSNNGSLLFDETTLKEAVERNANEEVTVTKGEDDKYTVKYNKSGREYDVVPDGSKPDTGKQRLVDVIEVANYGDKVNYSVTVNGVTLDNWKIFYNDGNNVIMIYNDYLPNSTGLAAGAGLATIGNYTVYSSTSTSREDLIKNLNDESKWTSLIRSDLTGKATAKGAVDLETWVASWNAKGYQTLYTAKKTGMTDSIGWGYYVGTSENPTSIVQSVSSNAGYNDTLYFPYKSLQSNCNGYWLASPSAYDTRNVMRVYCLGNVSIYEHYYSTFGVCPAVYLNSSVLTSGKDASGAWVIE